MGMVRWNLRTAKFIFAKILSLENLSLYSIALSCSLRTGTMKCAIGHSVSMLSLALRKGVSKPRNKNETETAPAIIAILHISACI